MIKNLINIAKIWHWHKKTFPNYTATGQTLKLKGEINEYEEAFNKFTKTHGKTKWRWNKKTQEELVDVIISSINAMRFEEIRQEVNKKMEINYNRTWKGGHHER